MNPSPLGNTRINPSVLRIKAINKTYVHKTILSEASGRPLDGLPSALSDTVSRALDGVQLSRDHAWRLAESSPDQLPYLCAAAGMIRDYGKGRVVSFSPKAFIPLTRLCKDFCGYCTFRQSPEETNQLYMTPEEVLEVAKAADKLGCTEALLTLGERPEQLYPKAKEWLKSRGYRTTIDYLHEVSALILNETTLLPHANPGTMSHREMAKLQPVNASMGIMLENISDRLRGPGGPHERAPSKWPSVRMKTLTIAGKLKVPFTTGILIGIGETRREVVDSLLAIRDLHKRYGHIQEVIIQNFRAKPDTAMRLHPDAEPDYLLWSVAAARIILGPDANIQIPPNLMAEEYPVYLLAGVNDWGGVSPLTIDYVNPEAPWPQLSDLRTRTKDMGLELKPRLPVYPVYITSGHEFIPDGIMDRIIQLTDQDGYVNGGIERYVRSLS